jgi:hypothetical protein
MIKAPHCPTSCIVTKRKPKMSKKLKPPYPLCYHKKTKYKNNKNKQASLKSMKLCGISNLSLLQKKTKNKLSNVKPFSLDILILININKSKKSNISQYNILIKILDSINIIHFLLWI